jgi:tetratricopeptide (TPR) repeat protein
LDWSYELLSPELRRFFVQLSVFRGGWTAEAAAAVCVEPRALEFLERLRESSLVTAEEVGVGNVAEPGGSATRFRLLESLREYGAEQLNPEEQASLARRHATYYLALAEEAEPHLTSGRRGGWMDRLDQEQDNLRAVFVWSLGPLPESGQPLGIDESASQEPADNDQLTTGMRLAGALAWFWFYRGYLTEGRRWIDLALEREAHLPGEDSAPERVALRRKLLYGGGLLAWDQGDLMSARVLLQKSVALGREMGDTLAFAYSLVWRGRVGFPGRRDQALAHLAESTALFREAGDAWGLALSLAFLGDFQDSEVEARMCYEESIRLFRSLQDPWGLALPLSGMGRLARQNGDFSTAVSMLEETLALRRGVGHRFSIAMTLVSLGLSCFCQGDLPRAKILFEECLELHQSIGNKLESLTALWWLVDVARFQGVYEAGQSRSEEALALSQEMKHPQGIAGSLTQMAKVALDRADFQRAAALFTESLAMHRDCGNPNGIAWCLEGLASLAIERRELSNATRLFGAAVELRKASGYLHSPPEQSRIDLKLTAIQSAMDEDSFATTWSAGCALTGEEAAAEALGETEPSSSAPLKQTSPPAALMGDESHTLTSRGDLTAREWEQIAPLLPSPIGRRGRPFHDHRRVINGILWKLRTKAPWRDLPVRYGPWRTCDERYRRWQQQGIWDRIMLVLRNP